MKQLRKKLKEKKGFTLIEMIIVIAIIAILIALVAPNLKKYLDTAKQTKADAGAKTVYTAASTYLVDKYARGETVNTSAAWTKATAPSDFISDYFNDNEIKDKDFTITFDDTGNVKTVEYNEDGNVKGVYPKQDTTSDGGGEETPGT